MVTWEEEEAEGRRRSPGMRVRLQSVELVAVWDATARSLVVWALRTLYVGRQIHFLLSDCALVVM